MKNQTWIRMYHTPYIFMDIEVDVCLTVSVGESINVKGISGEVTESDVCINSANEVQVSLTARSDDYDPKGEE